MSKTCLAPLVVLLIALTTPGAVRAQSIGVRVVSAESGLPLQGALVTLIEGEARVAVRQLTNARGIARFTGLKPGPYGIRAEMIGHETEGRSWLDVVHGRAAQVELPLRIRPLTLRGVEAQVDERCHLRPSEGLQVAAIWDEIRKALEAARWTASNEVYEYRIEKWLRDMAWKSREVLHEEWEHTGGFSAAPFESLSAERLAAGGYVQAQANGEELVYYAPDADALLSDAFLDTHCMRLEIGSGAREGWVGLAFRPLANRRVPDISGTLWLDPGSWELKQLDYVYEEVRRAVPIRDVGGDIRFQRLPDGTWIIPTWTIRMPLLGIGRDIRGRERLHQVGVREQGGKLLRLRRRGGQTVLTEGSGTIEGVVLDSLGFEAVPGAVVELVGFGDAVVTDASGVFALSELQPGRYRVRFDHESMAAFQYRPEPEIVHVQAGEVTPLTLRLPSLGELLTNACAAEAGGTASGRVVGRVLDRETGLPLPGAVVRIERDGAPGIDVVTNDAGYYWVCGLPSYARLTMTPMWRSFEGAGGTVQIPGNARMLVHDLSVPISGRASLAGTVRESSTGIPVEGATVRLHLRPSDSERETQTDAFGRFVLDTVPSGAQRLSVSHPAYLGGDGPLSTRPGERVVLRLELPRIPVELRRMLPRLAMRTREVRVEVLSRSFKQLPDPESR